MKISGTSLLTFIEACKISKCQYIYACNNSVDGNVIIASTNSTNSKFNVVNVYIPELDIRRVGMIEIAFDMLECAENIKQIIPVLEYDIGDKGINLKGLMIINFNNYILYNISYLMLKINNILDNTTAEYLTHEEMDTIYDQMKSMKADNGSKIIHITNQAITVYANMIPMTKADTVIGYRHSVYNNSTLYRFTVKKPHLVLDVYILYLYIPSNISRSTQ